MQSLDLRSILGLLLLSVIIWLLSRSFYRLSLSPLAGVPGPKLAAMTSLYAAFYDILYPAQYVFKIKSLHQQYGPIIRVSPHEVHVNDVEFLDQIYNPTTRKRNKYLPNLKGLRLDQSMGAAKNWEIHRMRREAVNPFFSHSKVMSTEELLRDKIQEFRRTIDDFVGSDRILNLSDLYFALALDIVQKYSFGQDQDILANLGEANRLRNNLSSLLRGTKFNLYFGWLLGVLSLLPKRMGASLIPPGVIDLMTFRKNIRQNLEAVFADKENKLRGQVDSVFSDLKDNPNLPGDERTIDRLEDEGSLLIMAGKDMSYLLHQALVLRMRILGTESTAKSMHIAHLYLLANPYVMHELREELRKAGYPTALKGLEQLPYLSAVIHEANRLSFGLTGRNTRLAPEPEVLQYQQHVLPSGTAISMTTLCVHTNEEIFPDPWKFNPDRFLGRDGLARRKYMMSMGRGTYKCIGINLASAEMCMAIAAIARYEMELFDTDEDDVRFQYDYHVAHPRLDTKGVRVRVISKF